MISISDNTASDTLIRVLGQDIMAETVRLSGHSRPHLLAPMLMTQQNTAFKMPANDDLRIAFENGNELQQAEIITNNMDRLSLAAIDFGVITANPRYIDTIEWFASNDDVASLFAYLDSYASSEARAIMAINPGIGEGAAKQWQYLGYKGGSEPGVLSMNFLAMRKNGEKFVVSAQWNDTENSLQESRFITLVTRLMDLLSRQNP